MPGKPVNPTLRAGHPLSRGVVATWPFARSLDRLETCRPPIVSGPPSWVAGRYGPALRFGGGLYLNTGLAVAALPVGIEWIGTPDTSAEAGTFDAGPLTGGVLRQWTAGNVEWHDTDPSVSLGQEAGATRHWYVEYFYDSNRQIRVYRDGILYASGTGGTSSAFSFVGLVIGSINTGFANYSGTLELFRVHTVRRTAGEVAALAADPFALVRPPDRLALFAAAPVAANDFAGALSVVGSLALDLTPERSLSGTVLAQAGLTLDVTPDRPLAGGLTLQADLSASLLREQLASLPLVATAGLSLGLDRETAGERFLSGTLAAQAGLALDLTPARLIAGRLDATLGSSLALVPERQAVALLGVSAVASLGLTAERQAVGRVGSEIRLSLALDRAGARRGPAVFASTVRRAGPDPARATVLPGA